MGLRIVSIVGNAIIALIRKIFGSQVRCLFDSELWDEIACFDFERRSYLELHLNYPDSIPALRTTKLVDEHAAAAGKIRFAKDNSTAVTIPAAIVLIHFIT